MRSSCVEFSPLERRQLLASVVNFVNGALSVTNDDDSHTLTISKPLLNVILKEDGVTIGQYLYVSSIEIIGGGGNDRIEVASGQYAGVPVSFRGGAGNDTLDGSQYGDDLYGDDGDDVINGRSSQDLVDGGEGDDTLDGSAGNDTIVGGNGIDAVDYSTYSGPIGANISLDGVANDTYNTNTDWIQGDIEVVYGTNQLDTITGSAAGNDTLYGNSGPDRITAPGLLGSLIFAGNGNDTVYGSDADDIIFGGAGTDYVYAAAGNDSIFGEGNGDYLYGEDGDDDFFTNVDNWTDRIFGGNGTDHVTSKETWDVLDSIEAIG